MKLRPLAASALLLFAVATTSAQKTVTPRHGSAGPAAKTPAKSSSAARSTRKTSPGPGTSSKAPAAHGKSGAPVLIR